jgi:hypothetical protein
LGEIIPMLQTEIEQLLKESKDRTIAMPFPKASFDTSPSAFVADAA